MAPFRLGLIGAGRMGRTHLRGLAGSERVAVTAIAEVSEQTRRALPGGGAPVYPRIAEMLGSETLDGVLIVVPTDRHLQVITEVAAYGLPILCEKPCGLTVAQTRAAVAAAEGAGVPFQVAYWRRYVPPLQALRDAIAAGDLGTVHLVACYQWDDRPPTDEFRAHSGGILADMGVHEFDQMRWLTGQEIGAMAAIASGVVPGGLVRHAPGEEPHRSADADSAQVLVELSGGASGIVSLGRFHPAGDMARAEAFGTKRTVRCDFLDPAEGEKAQLDALRRQAESFAGFARGGPCTGATGADAIAALDAAARGAAAIPALAAGGPAGPGADGLPSARSPGRASPCQPDPPGRPDKAGAGRRFDQKWQASRTARAETETLRVSLIENQDQKVVAEQLKQIIVRQSAGVAGSHSTTAGTPARGTAAGPA